MRFLIAIFAAMMLPYFAQAQCGTSSVRFATVQQPCYALQVVQQVYSVPVQQVIVSAGVQQTFVQQTGLGQLIQVQTQPTGSVLVLQPDTVVVDRFGRAVVIRGGFRR